ncbi:hypothetical protein NMG60_11018517 [Bertholletia excelsa]
MTNFSPNIHKSQWKRIPLHIFGVKPLLVAVICIAVAALLLLTYHFIVAWWFRRSEFVPRPSGTRRFEVNFDEEMLSSLETSISQLIPSCKYSRDIGLASKTRDQTSVVCLCEFLEGEAIRVLPKCSHPFHVPCIDMWLFSHLVVQYVAPMSHQLDLSQTAPVSMT